jgi:hypothetical protein
MASTINTTNIDVTYPIAGQDNDTQGFRDNFRNIKNNLNTAASEITALQSNAITLQSTMTNLATNANANTAAYLTTYTGNITANSITLSSVVQFANLTTTQVNAISPTNRGMTVYNYTTGNIQVYNGTKWANVTLS